jgi:hypothetical protein
MGSRNFGFAKKLKIANKTAGFRKIRVDSCGQPDVSSVSEPSGLERLMYVRISTRRKHSSEATQTRSVLKSTRIAAGPPGTRMYDNGEFHISISAIGHLSLPEAWN